MIWEVNFYWLLFAVAAVTAIAYMLSLWLDFLMRDQAYGPFGNALIITGGFFGAIFGANYYGIDLSAIGKATAYGLGGAFVLFFVATLARTLSHR